MDIREVFKKNFKDNLRRLYYHHLEENRDKNLISNFEGYTYKKLHDTIGTLFSMDDKDVLKMIKVCIDAGFSTKEDIAVMFGVAENTFNKRVYVADYPLRNKWNLLVDKISETFDEIDEAYLFYKKINEDTGKEEECGYVYSVYVLAAKGLNKEDICTQLKFNPSDFDTKPVITNAYKEGKLYQNKTAREGIGNAINEQVIKTNYFAEKLLPGILKAALGHYIETSDTTYIYVTKEDPNTGKEVRVKVEKGGKVKTKWIPADKEAVKIALRLCGGDLLLDTDLETPNEDKLLGLPNVNKNLFNEKGNAKDFKEVEYEDISSTTEK